MKVFSMEGMNCDEAITAMLHGLNAYAKRYKVFTINGFRFHKKVHKTRRQTENSAIVVGVIEWDKMGVR